jgi:hypothetical protein
MNIGNMTYPGAGSGFDTAKTKTPIAITPKIALSKIPIKRKRSVA